jgi:hypothetical protein
MSERVGHGNSSSAADATAHASRKPIDDARGNAEEFGKMLETDSGQSDMEYYLNLQKEMLKEQQAYTALSNVIKARSDACLSAVRNFKQ